MSQPNLQTPGLYLQGRESEAAEPLFSAVTGLVGVAQRGPMDFPQPIRNWGDYLLVFGGFVPYGYLAESVFGFFLNGGEKCFVVRIGKQQKHPANSEDPPGPCSVHEPLFRARALVDGDGNAGIEAIDPGSWGNSIKCHRYPKSSDDIPLTELQVEAADETTTIEVTNLDDIGVGDEITVTHRDDASNVQSFTVTTVDNGNPSLILNASVKGPLPAGSVVSGKGFRLKVVYEDTIETFDNLSRSTDNPHYFPNVVNGDPDVRDYIERQKQGFSILVRVNPEYAGKLPPAPQVSESDVLALSDGGDGFTNAHKELTEEEGGGSETFCARSIKGEEGNGIMIKASPFKTKTALPTPAGSVHLAVENTERIALNDALTINYVSPETGLPTSTTLSVWCIGRILKLSLSYVARGRRMTVSEEGHGEQTISLAPEKIRSGETESCLFEKYALTITLNDAFDKTEDIEATEDTTIGRLGDIPGDYFAGNVIKPDRGFANVEFGEIGDNFLALLGEIDEECPLGSEVTIDGRFDLEVRMPGETDPVKRFINIGVDQSDSDHFFVNVVNNDPYKTVCILRSGNPTTQLTQLMAGIELQGGLDPGAIDYRYHTGYKPDGEYFQATEAEQPHRCGLATLDEEVEVSLVGMPDLSRARLNSESGDDGTNFVHLDMAQKDLLSHCANAGERFALLEPKEATNIDDMPAFVQKFPDPTRRRFGAVYYPWLTARFDDGSRPVPPCGFVAGLMARSDRLHGVNKAPANLAVKGTISLEQPIDETQQHYLNKQGVNCLRKLEDGVIALLGARTLSAESKFRYVNVRRVILAMVKALSRKLLWAVFEPSEPRLWVRVKSSVEGYLRAIMAGGVTASSSAEEAFYVKCNEETNTPEEIEAGRVVTEIGVALNAPAEFIVLTARTTPESSVIIEEQT